MNVKSLSQYKNGNPKKIYDYIFIGSGPSCLTAASLLAESGKSIAIFEKHYEIGGFMHTFQRKKMRWDVGVHYIGEVHRERSVFKSIFEYITDANIKWEPMGDGFDQIMIGDDYHFSFGAGKEQYRDSLLKAFPKESVAIDQYINDIHELNSAASSYYGEKVLPNFLRFFLSNFMRKKFLKYSNQTTREYLDKITSNERLKTVLTTQWGDYGLTPKESSFAIHALVAKHYINGAAFPIGGSNSIVNGYLKRLEKYNVDIISRAGVVKVLEKDNKAIGIELSDGTQVLGKNIISGIGLSNTLKIAPSLSEDYQSELSHINSSCGHLCLYLALDKPLDELGISKGNQWHYLDDDHDKQSEIFVEKNKDLGKSTLDMNGDFPILYFSFASSKDPNHSREHATMEVITMAPFEWFEKWKDSTKQKRPDDYKEFKRNLTQKIEEQLYKKLPQIKDHVIYKELSTPLSTKHFSNYDYGQIYGLNHTVERFQSKNLRPQTKLKNFYLTGQDIVTAGIGGAIMSGVVSASKIAGKNWIGHILKSEK